MLGDPTYGATGGAAATNFLGLNLGNCQLCQSPVAGQFLFFTAILAALAVWWYIIEE